MKNENEKAFKEYFRNQGFKYLKKGRLVEYIDYEFLIYNNDEESIAIYTLDLEKESIHSLLEAARSCSLSKPSIKICLCVPWNCYLPADVKMKIENTKIEIYTLKDRFVEIYLRASDIAALENGKLESLKKLIKNINLVSSNYLGFPLFKINNNLFKKLKIKISSEQEFFYQIQTLVSILEDLDYKRISENIKTLKTQEKKLLQDHHSISVIELIFKKKRLNNDQRVQHSIRELRNLRDLRNMPPSHPSSKYKKVCKSYIGKQIPKTSADWKKLSQIVLSRFEESLITIKGYIIGK